MQLFDIEAFTTDQQFSEIKQAMYALVEQGDFQECGLDPNDPWHFVEVFKALDGSEWHLAVPDHAFRGYLKRVK